MSLNLEMLLRAKRLLDAQPLPEQPRYFYISLRNLRQNYGLTPLQIQNGRRNRTLNFGGSTTVTLEVHLLSHDDEQMLEWSLRHYALTLGARVVVHDGGPKGISSQIAECYEGVESRPWDTGGRLDDEAAMKLKNACWKGSTADWVACVDADELLWFPQGIEPTLTRASQLGAAILRPHGFEMFSDEWIEPEDGSFITDHVQDGAPDDKWYGKPVLFSPRVVEDSGFGIGAHESKPLLKNGRRLTCGANWPFANPPVYLLHFKSIFGGLERIAARYDGTRARLSETNIRHRWGNFKPGMEHAQEKRALLLPHVRRVLT